MEESGPSILATMNSWFTPTVLFIFLNLTIATILFTSNLPNNNNNTNTTTNKQQEDHKEKTTNQNDDVIQSKPIRSPSVLHRLRSLNLYPQHNPSLITDQSLEIAATEYVFNHPFTLEHEVQPVSENPNSFHLHPTRFDSSDKQPDTEAADTDFNHTNEVQLDNAQTHFVYEPNHTIEKVTTHFDFGPTRINDENPEDILETHEEEHETENENENDELKGLDEIYGNITGGHVNRTKSDTLPASGEVPVKLPAKIKKSASLKSAFSHFEEDKIVEARRPATVRERRSAARAAEDDDVEVDAKADDFINKFKHQLKLQRLDSIVRYKDMVNRGSAKSNTLI